MVSDPTTNTSTLRIVPAREAPFADVASVFGTRGDPAGCWCQWYKLPRADFEKATRDELRDRLAGQLDAPGPGPGLLAYEGETPVGWCAIEPRPALARLPRSRIGAASPDDDFADGGVWAVSCFVIPREFRRRGVAASLAEAAVEHARRHGAHVLEAYAVDPTAREKVPAADLFPGTVSMYRSAGFTEVARPTPHRVVMQRRLDD
ncbi:GNAT family N-acetyltransferase [Agromyces aurantiacus]|uniref:GNAT family N-acetyltransferase n=1 Tax=Agromyces aurantiacus TaxID=165814 RepID=A0ABV9RA13_9MICO|nr:GNAT family N-acetyltransferase [Agromyces aurantiacus]MBM7504540.1 GNAT superfamily N-acetyltransferase [Agromyces aurantiacus]